MEANFAPENFPFSFECYFVLMSYYLIILLALEWFISWGNQPWLFMSCQMNTLKTSWHITGGKTAVFKMWQTWTNAFCFVISETPLNLRQKHRIIVKKYNNHKRQKDSELNISQKIKKLLVRVSGAQNLPKTEEFISANITVWFLQNWYWMSLPYLDWE